MTSGWRKRGTQQPKAEQERLELIGHADLAINNIYIFNGYGEDVPEGRTPIYAGYQQPKHEPLTDEQIKEMWLQLNPQSLVVFARAIEAAHGITASEAEDSAKGKA